MSYYDYKITDEGFARLVEFHGKTMKNYAEDVADRPMHWSDIQALEEGRSIEIRGGETYSGNPECFDLDREDPRYFTKTLIEEDEA